MEFLLLGLLLVAVPILGSLDPWRNALILFAVVVAGLVSMTYYVPLGAALDQLAPGVVGYAQAIALLGISFVSCLALVACFWRLLPEWNRVQRWPELAARYTLALIISYLLVGLLMNAAYTMPLPQSIAMQRNHQGASLLGVLSPDLDWVRFIDHVSVGALQTDDSVDQQRIWNAPRFDSRRTE